jgi:hypothetical protein
VHLAWPTWFWRLRIWNSVQSLAVVLADGRVLHTGSAATDGAAPFYRHYGPDLAGPFLIDSGALGIKAAARVAMAGRGFVDEHGYSIHMSIEHRYQVAVVEAVREVTEACEHHGGRIMENSILTAVRGTPFGPLNIVIGVAGERWIPTHGLMPHSKAVEVEAEVNSLFEARSAELEAQSIEWALGLGSDA